MKDDWEEYKVVDCYTRRSDYLTMYSTVMHGDEVPPPGSDLENKARHICQQISLQDLDDIVIRDMGIVRHPLDPNDNRSIDVYPLKFINTNRFGVETKTLFLISRAEVKGKGEIGSYMGPGSGKLSPGNPRGKMSFPLRMSSEGGKNKNL